MNAACVGLEQTRQVWSDRLTPLSLRPGYNGANELGLSNTNSPVNGLQAKGKARTDSDADMLITTQFAGPPAVRHAPASFVWHDALLDRLLCARFERDQVSLFRSAPPVAGTGRRSINH